MSGLPDVLDNNLNVIFCGTGAGKRSGEIGQYYTGKGNLFWQTLYDIKLTPRKLDSSEFKEVKKYGVGLTDMTKVKAGPDSGRKKHDYDRERFEQVITEWKPKCIAFNGKKAAELAFNNKVAFGRYTLYGIPTFVLPSTSAMARSFWDIKYWKELADFIKK